jgi:curved DNA-binding protein CbpA
MNKKIQQMDFYELLNLHIEASPKDIENAYLMAVTTYHQDGLASYGALGDLERELILNRIEEAFETLRDPEKKRAYDLFVISVRPELSQRARFRRSTRKLDIEDASEEVSFWDRIRTAAKRSWSRRNGREKGPNGENPENLTKDFPYYGDYLKMVRERRGLSRENIAERCGISPELIELLEKENPIPLPQEEEALEGLKLYAKSLGLGTGKGKVSPFSDRIDE